MLDVGLGAGNTSMNLPSSLPWVAHILVEDSVEMIL